MSTPVTQAKGNGAGAVLNYFKVPAMGHAAMLAGNPNIAALTLDAQPIILEDVRGNEDKFNIDVQGFEYIKHNTTFKDWDNPPACEAVYYREILELVKERFGATRCFAVDHNRRGGSSKPAIGRAHIDRTPASSRERLWEFVGDDGMAEMNANNTPYLLLSVWRPLEPVQRDPLVCCNKLTVNNKKDLVTTPRPLKNGARGVGELFWVRKGENHQWCYQSEQDIDDVLFIKLVDSREGRDPVGVPHSSAQLDGQEGKARESIEVRVLAVFD